MSEYKKYIKIKIGSEKNFGIVFSIVFLIVGCYPLIMGGEIIIWSLITSLIFLFLAYFFPKALYFPNKLWFKLGLLLGAIVGPIVMTIIYFVTVFPTGLIIRLIGKDILRLKLDKNTKSYWIERKENVGSMKDQF